MFDHGFSMKIARDTGLKPCEFHVQIIWGLAREFFYPNHLLHFSIPDHWSLWMHKDQMVGRSYVSLVQTISGLALAREDASRTDDWNGR